MSGQGSGPIVFVKDSHRPSTWAKFLEMKNQDKFKHLKRILMGFDGEIELKNDGKWSWRKLLKAVIGIPDKKQHVEPNEPYNLYNRKPDFKNSYGWSIALDDSDYSALSNSGIGVYIVHLTAVIICFPFFFWVPIFIKFDSILFTKYGNIQSNFVITFWVIFY